MNQMVMPYRRSRGRRPVVFSIKHVVDSSATLAAATSLNTVVLDAVQTPVLTTPNQVAIGSRVSSIYLKVEVVSNETDVGAIPNAYMIVFYNPSNALTTPDPSSVGTSDVKRYVIHQEMVMLNNLQGGNPRVLFQGVIRIPRSMQRNGNDDVIQISIRSPAVNIALCIQCIYKEFR